VTAHSYREGEQHPEKGEAMEMRNQRPAPEVPLTEPAPTQSEAQATGGRDDGAAADAVAVQVGDGEQNGQQEIEAPASLQEQLAQQRQQAEEYLNHLQRLQAEFQNYRRRVTQEKAQAISRGKEEVLRALLPILANLRLAVQHAEQDANAVRQGVQMIWQQFEGFLSHQGVERIATVGQPFDPAQHEVLSTSPATVETPANTIVSEIKAGYSFDGRLLCPAQVIVARAEETPVASEAEA
jgi:molecular chaperone GrpE